MEESGQTDAVPAEAEQRGKQDAKGACLCGRFSDGPPPRACRAELRRKRRRGTSGRAWRGPTGGFPAYRFPRECRGCTASRLAWVFPRTPRGWDAGFHRFRLLVGGALVVGTCLPVLRCPAGGRPGGAARVHPAGAPSATALLLVLLPQPGGLLPLRQRVPTGLDDGRPARKPASPVSGGWTCVTWRGLPLLAVVGLSACATIPTGPSVMILPGRGKTFEQFQTDDTAKCGAGSYYAARNDGYTVPRAASFAGKALALAQDPRQGLSPPHAPTPSSRVPDREGRTAVPRRTLPRTVRSGRNCRLYYAPHSRRVELCPAR